MYWVDIFNDAGISWTLVGVVFAASSLQAITGIGFGVIAGPSLLVSMGSSSAIQVSIVLSFLIAIILCPDTLQKVNWTLLKPLLFGVAIGTPLGALAYLSLSIGMLKAVAAVIVFAMTLIAAGFLANNPIFTRDSPKRRTLVGVVCGTLNTMLAMPGPPVAAFATAIRMDKEALRATTLVTFLFAYPIALSFHASFAGLSDALSSVALPLTLPTLLGTLTGVAITRKIDERWFKWLTVALLSMSVLKLVWSG